VRIQSTGSRNTPPNRFLAGDVKKDRIVPVVAKLWPVNEYSIEEQNTWNRSNLDVGIHRFVRRMVECNSSIADYRQVLMG